MAWVGVALTVSTTHDSATGPVLQPRSLQQQSADQAAFEARITADRTAHPVPAVELRRAERQLEVRLRRQHAGAAASATCRRSSEWNLSCVVVLTPENGVPAQSYVDGHYLPQARMVLFDSALP